MDSEAGSFQQEGGLAAVWVYSGAPHCCVYRGHTDSVICLQSEEEKLISGSVDTTIRVWSVQQPACENVLQGHTDWVRCMHCSGSTLASGSDDHTIRIWDLTTNECLQTFEALSVNCVQLSDDRVYYGTEEGFVHGLDIGTGKQAVSLEGHTQSVNCMHMMREERKLLTGSGDCTVRVWDLEREECVGEIRTHSYSVNCLSVSGGILYTGSGDCKLHAVDLSANNEHILTFTGHASPVFCLKVLDQVLVSGSGDCSLRVWNSMTGQCLRELPGSPGQNDVMLATGHMDWVNAVDIADGYIFSGSVDRTIRRWHLASLLSDVAASLDGASSFAAPSFIDSIASLGAAAAGYGSGDVNAAPLKVAEHKEGFSWGHNRDGALGLGSYESHSVPMGMDTLQGCNAVAVCCGGGAEEHHTCIVTADGGLMTFGSGVSGQLGQDCTQNLPVPVPVSGLIGTKVTVAACGSAHTLVATSEGRVLSFGWGYFGQLGIGSTVNSSSPVPVTALQGITVIQVSCGSAHSVACTDHGKVYTWGWGVNGQLGHGDDSSLLLPSAVKRLDSTYVSQVACGLAHTVAIAQVEQGVYTWGWDEYGQLGHGGWDLFATGKNKLPRLVKDLVGKSVTQAACGSSHTLVLTTKGEIYTFGWGKDGQLGLGSSVKDRKTPTLLRTLGDVEKIAACGSHSLALQRSGGLFSWGNNTSGQLGLGHTETCSVPTRLGTLHGYNIRAIACAGGVRFGHTVCLVDVDSDTATVPGGGHTSAAASAAVLAPPEGAYSHLYHGTSSSSASPSVAAPSKLPLGSSLSEGGDAFSSGSGGGSAARDPGVVVSNMTGGKECSGGEIRVSDGAGCDASLQMTARERLVNMGERVKAAHVDHTSGLNRLLGEFQGACQNVQRGKKESVEARQQLAQQQLKLEQQLLLLRRKQVAAAAAERFEEAQTWKAEILSCEADLSQCLADVKRIVARFEELEEECSGFLRKEVLARREAFKFLSSVLQDAEAKADQYRADAHDQVERERSTSERNVAVCTERLEELELSLRDVADEIEGTYDKEEMERRNAALKEASVAAEAAKSERVAIENEIAALQRTLAVRMEREKECIAARERAMESVRNLEESEEGGCGSLRHMKDQLLLEQSRVKEELETSRERHSVVEKEAELLRDAEEQGMEILEQLQHLITESTAELAKAETDQRHRLELSLRRRKLMADDANGGSFGVIQGDEARRCEIEIENMSREVLSLQQSASKIRQTATSIKGQLGELEVQKQLAVDTQSFSDAGQIKSKMIALAAALENETLDLSLIEMRLESLQAEIITKRQHRDEVVRKAKSKETLTTASTVELLNNKAIELQALMEEEIEQNNFEAAALLQVEVEAIQMRCTFLGEALHEESSQVAPHEESSHEESSMTFVKDSLSTSQGVVGSGKESETREEDGVAAEMQMESKEGDVDLLNTRISVLTEQLEAALREEEFDLCDRLNVEITQVTEQRDALLS